MLTNGDRSKTSRNEILFMANLKNARVSKKWMVRVGVKPKHLKIKHWEIDQPIIVEKTNAPKESRGHPGPLEGVWGGGWPPALPTLPS